MLSACAEDQDSVFPLTGGTIPGAFDQEAPQTCSTVVPATSHTHGWVLPPLLDLSRVATPKSRRPDEMHLAVPLLHPGKKKVGGGGGGETKWENGARVRRRSYSTPGYCISAWIAGSWKWSLDQKRGGRLRLRAGVWAIKKKREKKISACPGHHLPCIFVTRGSKRHCPIKFSRKTSLKTSAG